MLIVYSSDRAERLAAQYEKMYWFTVQRTLLRMAVNSRTFGDIRLDRGVYAMVYKKKRLHIVIEHEWINEGSVLL